MTAHSKMFGLLPAAIGMLVATTVTCTIGALLPPTAGFGLFVGGLALMGVLLAGWLEGPAVRLLIGAREPRTHELAALRPAIQLVGQRGLLPPEVDLLVRRRSPGIQTGAIGRRTVLISEGLASSCARGTLRPEETAALLAHAIARIRLGQTRFDVATEFWLLPWRALEQIVRAVAGPISWFPLTRLAWRIRGVIGLVALVEASSQGRAWLGVLATAAVALSYLLPWCELRASRAAELEADAVVVRAGLGPQLAAFLTRGRPTPRVLARAQRLRGGAAPPHPMDVPA